MRTAMIVVYVAMAMWLVLAAFARIVIQLAAGQDLDPLPFVGGAIGLVALVLLLPAWEDRRSRNRD
jgi:hypothetical protein